MSRGNKLGLRGAVDRQLSRRAQSAESDNDAHTASGLTDAMRNTAVMALMNMSEAARSV